MAKTQDYHIEVIECPECETRQAAKVEHTYPFLTLLHQCARCGYWIMESEWSRVKDALADGAEAVLPLPGGVFYAERWEWEGGPVYFLSDRERRYFDPEKRREEWEGYVGAKAILFSVEECRETVSAYLAKARQERGQAGLWDGAG